MDAQTVKSLLIGIFSFLGSATGIAIIGLILKFVLARRERKRIASDSNKIDEGFDKLTNKLKEVSFNQTLEPIAKSELEKINEKCDERLEKALVRMEQKYLVLIDIIEKLSHIFDNSLVPQNVKDELQNAIKSAKEEIEVTNEQELGVIVEEEPIIIKPIKEKKNKISR